jgi:hypothetical protein
MNNVRNLDPAPYRLVYSKRAMSQLAQLGMRERQRVRSVLAQIAEMAAFAAPHAGASSRMQPLVTIADAISIHYAVDDDSQVVEVDSLAR